MKVCINHKDSFFNRSKRFKIRYGGAGSAKSYTTAQEIVARLVSEENHNFLVGRKVARTLRVSVFKLFKEIIYSENLQSLFTINKSDMTIINKQNNSMITFFGFDDIEKVKSIQGITSIWCEETSEFELNDIMELDRRLRGITKYEKQIILTFNPISHLHWLKSHFFDIDRDDVVIYKTTYLDNTFIDEEYKTRIEDIKNYDEQQYNIYALGEWGVMNQNIVYHNFKKDKHSTTLTINDFDILHAGIDFNIGGCVCILCGIKDDKCFVVDGFSAFDTQAIANQLMTYKKQIILYPDASGNQRSTNASRSDIQILQFNGFQVIANNQNPPIRDRVNSVNRLFAQDKLFINSNVQRLIHSLSVQAYTDKGEPEKFTKHQSGAVDDWNDALGYFIEFYFGFGKPTIKQQTLNFR